MNTYPGQTLISLNEISEDIFFINTGTVQLLDGNHPD
jgi:hypothetical protein